MRLQELIAQGAKFGRQGHWPVDKFIKLGTIAEMNLEQYQIDATNWEEHDGKCFCERLSDRDLILIDEGQYTFFGMGKLSDGTYYLRATAEDELNVDIKFCPFCGRKLV